jgi:hypothetical protein
MSARESWAKEMESVFLYRILAEVEPAPERRALFDKLAGEATAQAGIWAERIQKTEGKPPDGYVPPLRARVVAALLRRLGPQRMRGVLSAMKVRGMSVYAASPHAGHPVPHSVEEVGRRHRTGVAGGNLRAAVFGASDGLVSNFCLILGVAGAASEGQHVLVAGVAGLLAGAFSMAAGEWISVRSQREMFEHQIGAERDELAEYPDQEAAKRPSCRSSIRRAGLAKTTPTGWPRRSSSTRPTRSTRWRARSSGSIPARWARRSARRCRRSGRFRSAQQ